MKPRAARLYVPMFALLAASGCVAQRGIDFGHWLGAAELTPLIRVAENSARLAPAGTARILLLPPVGDLPRDSATALQRELYREACNYFPVSVSSLPADARSAAYVAEDNLLPNGTTFNLKEAARLGAALGATHVLCVHVCQYRPYPPQVLSLRMALVDTATARTVGEIDASFDASQQEVSIAIADYLQRRSVREYGNHSLGILIRSPVEYAAFVSACCCRSLARAVWGTTVTKETGLYDDTTPQVGIS